MIDVSVPEMAGSGGEGSRAEGEATGKVEVGGKVGEVGSKVEVGGKVVEVGSKVGEVGGQVRKQHKRSHSRNKSISGRQEFIEEIANNGEFKDKEKEAGEECEETLLPPKEQEARTSRLSLDTVDGLPENLRYNLFDLTCTLISMVTYLFDVVMDCVVAYYFYHLSSAHGIHHYWYFGLTMVFILLPSLTMTGFSFRWYLMDSDNHQLPEVSLWRWVLRLVVLVLQLAPVLRYIDSMR